MRADLTQAQLAEKIGVDPSYISYLEYGHRNITPELMTLLADALGVEEPEIFVRVEDAKR
jgi:transcriptional regulator with XRE-family HTH domain